MFEIHIAIPTLPIATTLETIAALKRAGLIKSKYFLDVNDLPSDGQQQACTPPTGHDLADPGVMTTVKISSISEAIRMVTEGMVILRSREIEGNFEVEEIISPASEDITLDLPTLFPDFQRIPDSPDFENHILWKGTASSLPSNKEVTKLIIQSTGVKPHQIVDFGYSATPAENDVITRVATIYQPSREATLWCGIALANQKDTMGYHHTVSEKVHMVGEWRH